MFKGKKVLSQENPSKEIWGSDDSEGYFWEEMAEMQCHDNSDDEIPKISPEAYKLFAGIYRSTKFTAEAAYEAFSKVLRKKE